MADKNEELKKKLQELNKSYDIVKENLMSNENKMKAVKKNIDKILKGQEKIKDEIFKIKANISEKRNKINEKVNDLNDNLHDKNNDNYFDNIEEECDRILDRIIVDDESKSNIFYIQAENKTLKKLDSNMMTFGDLKVDYCLKNNIKKSELYFTDIDQNIYLDNLNVKNVLFPIDNLYLQGNEPIIYVVKKNGANKEIVSYTNNNKSNEIQQDAKKDVENDEEDLNSLWIKFKDKVYIYIHYLFLIIYIFTWIFMLVDFRNNPYNNIVKSSFVDIKNNYFTKPKKVSTFLYLNLEYRNS